MTSSRNGFLGVIVVVVLLSVVAWLWRSSQQGVEAGAIDLIAAFPDAEKRTTMPSLQEGYAVETVVIDGDRKQALFAHPFSRIIWNVSVPPGAVLRTSAALRPDAWNGPGDGALFRVGISDGQTYTEVFRQMVQPLQSPDHRRWFPVEVDLTAYAGRQVQVIFNTEPGDSGNAVGDAAVWGAPRVVPNAARAD